MPPWYSLLSAARYLRVAPWDLAQKPIWWMKVALAAQEAEAVAHEKKAKKARSRNAHGR